MNYKDGLAITGKAPVVRRLPMIPGIDFAGTVETSAHPDFKPGDQVVLNGWGVGETHLGAYAQKARVKGDWLVPLPDGMTPRDAMAIGTAGYTAMLCVHGAGAARRHAGRRPGRGHRRGRRRRLGGDRAAGASSASRSSPRPAAPQEADYLKGLGAAEIIDRDELPARPSRSPRSAGPAASTRSAPHARQRAVDDPLWRRGRRLRPGAGHGPAGLGGAFILRGVSLLGIDFGDVPDRRRKEAWKRLESGLDRRNWPR